MNLYSVYDEVAQTFNAPFPEVNDFSAMRSFSFVCNDPATIIAKHPGDYYLYKVGTMDEHTGVLDSCPPDRLCRGSDFIQKEVDNV